MANRYVNVTITRQTQPVSQQGFGLPLILSTEKASAYALYSGATALADIGAEFGADSKTYKLAASILGQTPKVDSIAVYGISTYTTGDPASELSAALNTLLLTNNDWYYLTCIEQEDNEITELSNWIKTQNKLYFASTASKVLGTTLVNERTALLVHPNPETYPAEAWVGVGAPQTIGSFTWTFKTLNGILPAGYNDTDINTIETNNASTYIKEGGVNITSKGVTTSGEYIDIIQGQDYLQSRITENIYGLLTRENKVPFTTKGIALVISELDKALKDAFKNGVIAEDANGNPMFSVTAPKLATISDNDKANRKLPGVNWTATIAGAVENVDVNGTMEI